ncbi:hypothetical protein [Segeticoccus rhizosphaerae]|uniref:hypothetical protein n=1 Tax=Segeticoccus rhizosphaerae TaxID=1104777 RepID=UPI001396C375|nr:hypothetical protein [Segeticoccus rhizosphaerae]
MTSLPTFDGPVRSVAVLSDVHGVLPALDAALAEPAVAASANCHAFALTVRRPSTRES